MYVCVCCFFFGHIQKKNVTQLAREMDLWLVGIDFAFDERTSTIFCLGTYHKEGREGGELGFRLNTF